ncbi:MAG: ATP-binding protein [Gammaproteobacteria bacterium]|jgi:nitrogen fixation/metabolism regulation signal transduction histidine kinase
MFVSLYMLSETTQHSVDFDRLHVWLLLLNAGGVVALLVLIGVNLYRLVTQYRRHVPGSRLTARLVTMFVILAVVPVILVYYFSLQFLSRGIDSWFDVRVEQALDDSLELSRAALDSRVRELMSRVEHVADEMNGTSDATVSLRLDDLRRTSNASELTVFGPNGRIIATSSAHTMSVLPNQPPDDIMLQVHQGRPYVGLDPLGESGLFIRALAPVQPVRPGQDFRVLQGLFPVAERQNTLAQSVQAAYSRYRKLTYLRTPLKYSFILTLSLVLLLSLLAAVWGAFFSARRLLAPIQNLAAGTRAVARGDFDTRLPMPARDEVGFLVLSFNEMTSRLAEAREQASRSQQQVENERAYLEAVLSRLSSGVVAVDREMRLRAFNAAASEILGEDLRKHTDRRVDGGGDTRNMFREFMRFCTERLSEGRDEWREQILLHGAKGRRVLMCSCAALPGDAEDGGGHVIVFDDLTALMQAQRDAAWGEVARRLAHEIKNPLTPIQLAAERLRHKYLGRDEGSRFEVLDRATHTIIQQVESMKAMVNAFSEYARTPEIMLSRLDLNHLVGEVAELYRGRGAGIAIDLDLAADMPEIEADAGRLRQILHNLIKNAFEALEGSEDGRVRIATRLQPVPGDGVMAEIAVEDNGPGFDSDLLGQVFDPYVTSKPKGTGLGLAIVKKLVEEHGGTIRAENPATGGARLTVLLPSDEETLAHSLMHVPRNEGEPTP